MLVRNLANLTGLLDFVTSTRAPGGSSQERRPSHHKIPCPALRCRTSTATIASGFTTSGLAKSACALNGTTNSASTDGQTTGPPAEKAYAVDPVGVDMTTPSQPKLESGCPSISRTTSSIRSLAFFSTVASFRAQVLKTSWPSTKTATSRVSRSFIS
ncbi:unannotated protein [freshwater metagenome]|uniref:Unannotated protein n=1 Tax=freshwater metagenome TaxID=449393 RepID=A0A6J6CF30_9ZZZZ